MIAADSAGIGGSDAASRFRVVDLLPAIAMSTALAVAFAWSQPEREKTSWWSAAAVGTVALVVAVVLRPFQVRLVRLLEGYWRPGRLTSFGYRIGVERHRAKQAQLTRLVDRAAEPNTSRQERQRGAWAEETLLRYPPTQLMLPTMLGNTLRSAEISCSRRYGIDSIWAFPRIYPLVSGTLRAEYDAAVDQYDSSARLAVAISFSSLLGTSVLLPRIGVVALFGLLGLILGWIAYVGAVNAAAQSGELLHVVFDLHRFDLLTALRVALPTTDIEERWTNEDLNNFFSPGRPEQRWPFVYNHAHQGAKSDVGSALLAKAQSAPSSDATTTP